MRAIEISERDWRRLQEWAKADGQRVENVWNRMMAAERARRLGSYLPALKLRAGENTEAACPYCGEVLLWWVSSYVPLSVGVALQCCKCKRDVVVEVEVSE